ncbi:MAG: hypothetical protein KKD31_09425 [Bacteroidetes bacterium]|nr:hypothetical protein [Bacteroidota bacterium]
MDRLSYSYYRRSSTITTVPVFLLKGSEKNASGENICKDYYAGGSPQPGRSFNASDYRFGYQGSEKDDEITSVTGSHYTTYFRELDTRLLRWWSLDPKSSATPWESPYMTMGGNPVWWNDPWGDSVDPSQVKKSDETSFNELETDIENKTGLDLTYTENEDGTGSWSYAKEKGFLGIKRAVVDKSTKTSRTARRDFKKAINSKQTLIVKPSSDGDLSSSGHYYENVIEISLNGVKSAITNTSSDLNKSTMGWAMTFFHEYSHTPISGYSARDPRQTMKNRYALGGAVKYANKIRRQLGEDYGQRLLYFVQPNSEYIPFSKAALNIILEGSTPSGSFICYDRF